MIRKKVRNISIKWQLLGICVLLVTAPTVTLGVLSYNIFRAEAYNSMNEKLETIARNWQINTETYIQEKERVLKREEALVKQKLSAVSIDVERMFKLLCDESGVPPPEDRLESLLKEISGIRIGRSGYVLVTDEEGNGLIPEKYISKEKRDLFRDKRYKVFMKQIVKRIKDKEEGDNTYDASFSGETGDSRRMQLMVFSHFAPMKLVVGASSYYTDFKSYELQNILQRELTYKMAEQKIGDKGYLWVINTQGEYVVSKNRLRDGENIADERDSKGAYVIREIIHNARNLKQGETMLFQYDWKNPGETRYSMKESACVYVPEWGWIIGASAYYDDFLEGLISISLSILLVCMVFIVVGSWAAYRFSLFISGPILELKSVSIKAAEGELNVNLGKVINVGGEVGSLAKSFEVMMKKLENKIKELEASRMELLRSNEELKTTQAQLVQSEKLAMIGQLAAGVAHEINNPTAFVMGNLGVLKKSIWRINQVMDKYGELEKRVGAMGIAELSKILNELIELKKEIELNYILTDLPDLINESLDGTQRIKKIVSDLRTFSQTDEGVCREADINELVESALTIAWNDLKYKADVVRDYGEVPPVLCYPTQISKAVLNIVMNAAYAIERDGVIKVMTYARGDDAYIEISDNGCGMSDEVLSHLFEPFYTTKPVGKGTGLGLSMVYNVIQKHNGEVYAKSKVGQGSTFFIRLPIVPIEG